MGVETRASADPMRPRRFRVLDVRRETADVVTLALAPADGLAPLRFEPGQFTMLYAFGVGEIPISISGDPASPERLVQTIRVVGAVSGALTAVSPGDVLGVRGPFGAAWPLAFPTVRTWRDVILVAGGIGLAPLRPVLRHVLANRGSFGRAALLYGARTPDDLLFVRELEASWHGGSLQGGAIVDSALAGAWTGPVGPVTALVSRIAIDPAATGAYVCGPEIMIRFVVKALADRGVPAERIFVSLERNMHCAVGFCGHCQLGPRFICREGPVLAWRDVGPLLEIPEA